MERSSSWHLQTPKASRAAAAAPLAPPTATPATPATRPVSLASPGTDFPSPYKNIRTSRSQAYAATPVDGKARTATPLPPAQRSSLLDRLASRLGMTGSRGEAAGRATETPGGPASLATARARRQALANLFNPEAGDGTALSDGPGQGPTESPAEGRARADAVRPQLVKILNACPARELEAQWQQLTDWVDEPEDPSSATPFARRLQALQLELVAERLFEKESGPSSQALKATLETVLPQMAKCRNFSRAHALLDRRLQALCRLENPTRLSSYTGTWGYAAEGETPHEQKMRALVLLHLQIGRLGPQHICDQLISDSSESLVDGAAKWQVRRQICDLACQHLTPAEHHRLTQLCRDDAPPFDQRPLAKSVSDKEGIELQLRQIMRESLAAHQPGHMETRSTQTSPASLSSALPRPAGPRKTEAKGSGSSHPPPTGAAR